MKNRWQVRGAAVAALALGFTVTGCGEELSGAPVDGIATVEQPVAVEGYDMAAIGAYKRAHDTQPAPILSGADQALLAQKDQAVRDRLNAHGGVSNFAAQASKILGYTQQGQITGYYCGPASTSEALALKNVSLSQSAAASLLKTDANGTAWYGINANVPSPTGYPIRDVLNYKLNTTYYEPVAVPYTPTSTDVTNFQNRLSYDIDNGWPMVGNAWEVAGGPHLTGHPANQEIFHWITFNGYGNYGATAAYEDSATTVWSTVPAYTSGFSSSTMTTILGGRGYIW